MIIEDFLRSNAELFPDKVAAICGGVSLTYGELYGLAIDRAKAMDVAGRIVPFKATASLDFLTNYFAIHTAGGTAAPLEKGIPDELFAHYVDLFSRTYAPPGTADVLYTTGTTGKSKGVLISHKAIVANAENLVSAQLYNREITFIINGPLNHIGSLSKIFPSVYVGATMHIIDGMKNMNLLFDAIDSAKGKVGTFLVPASIRMLLAFAKDKLASYADKIDFIETGAARISETDMRMLREILPYSRLYNTYASTETGIISTFDFNEGGCLPDCLGTPMVHSGVIITSDGRIACKGDTLMTGYLGDKESTSQVLSGGLLLTSDIGALDNKGRLRLKGRVDDVINIGGFKVSPVEVEDAALSLPIIKECVCIAANHPVLGTILKLLIVTDVPLDQRAVARFLRTKLEPYKVPSLYEKVESIHKTFNGKIDRKKYV